MRCTTRRSGAATDALQPATAARPASSASIPAPKCATGLDASIRDSVSSRTWPPNSPAFAASTVGPSTAATRSGSPRPQAIANGMPQTLPDGVVSGVLKSPCASNHASPSRIPGRARRIPASAPAWLVQSPPRTSSRAPSPPAASPSATWPASLGQVVEQGARGSSSAGRDRAPNPGRCGRPRDPGSCRPPRRGEWRGGRAARGRAARRASVPCPRNGRRARSAIRRRRSGRALPCP